MSRNALWAPRHLETWNWREAAAEDQQPQDLAFEVWSRPDHGKPGFDSRTNSDSNWVGWPLTLAWIGFTVASLAAVVFALSMLYSQLAATLTGIVASPGPPIILLAVSAASGLMIGLAGLALGSRKGPRTGNRSRLHQDPETSIAA